MIDFKSSDSKTWLDLRKNLRHPIVIFRKVLLKVQSSIKRNLLNPHFWRVNLFFLIHYTLLKWRRFNFRFKSPNKKIIAISRVEHIGDIIACEPVSRYVRQKYPEADIIWVVRKPYRELIENNPNIDKTLVVNCLTEWMYLAKTSLFDEILDLHVQCRVCPKCRKKLKKRTGNSKITLENYYNFGNLLSVFCQSAGLPPLNRHPCIHIPQTIIRRVDGYHLPNEFISIHSLTNEESRDWLLLKWEELIEKMINTWQATIVEVGLESKLKNIKSQRFINLCGKLSILETAEVIKRSQIFIGVDSGPAHMANAVGTYGIILLGHYRAFKYYTPFSGHYENGDHADIIHANGPAANIPVEKVLDAIENRLKKTNLMKKNVNYTT